MNEIDLESLLLPGYVRGLEEPARTVIVGIFWDQRSLRDLARELGVCKDTVTNIKKRAILYLREQLS